VTLSLSGFLPGDDRDGLSRLAPRLIEATEAVLDGAADDDTADVVIVGIVRGHSVKRARAKDDEGPKMTVEVRVLRIEAVDGPEADQVRAMVLRLADSRAGVSTLPGMPGDQLPDPTQVVDPDAGDDQVAKRRLARKDKPASPPFTDGTSPPADPIPPLPPRREDDDQ
jgi:hypothetical protein